MSDIPDLVYRDSYGSRSVCVFEPDLIDPNHYRLVFMEFGPPPTCEISFRHMHCRDLPLCKDVANLWVHQ